MYWGVVGFEACTYTYFLRGGAERGFFEENQSAIPRYSMDTRAFSWSPFQQLLLVHFLPELCRATSLNSDGGAKGVKEIITFPKQFYEGETRKQWGKQGKS